MRKAVTGIEVLVVICIILVLIGMLLPAIALFTRSSDTMVRTETNAIMKSTREQVYVVARDNRTSPTTFIIRKSDGAEIHVNKSELEVIKPKVEKE